MDKREKNCGLHKNPKLQALTHINLICDSTSVIIMT
jgi:hypothetical protein